MMSGNSINRALELILDIMGGTYYCSDDDDGCGYY
jgi:hypothetical protein